MVQKRNKMKLITTNSKIKSSDEIRVIVTLKNNRLLSLREKLGLCQIKTAKMAGVTIHKFQKLEQLKTSPVIEKDGVITWKEDALQLAQFFEVDVFWLFSEAVSKIKMSKIVVTGSVEQMPEYLFEDTIENPMLLIEKSEQAKAVQMAIATLSPNEEKVIRGLFFENKTLKNLGNELAVSSERIRQIELKALRKLGTPRRKRILNGETKLNSMDFENET